MCGITAYAGTCDGNGAGGLCGVDDVISGDVVNGDGCRRAGINEWVEVVDAENELPALSVPVTVASKDVSAARSEPATSMEKLLLESTVPE